jgi:adenine-specific DNA-methyltransferase
MEDENGQTMQCADDPDVSKFSPYTLADLRRTGFSNSASFDFECFGRTFKLGSNRQWKTGKEGMRRLLGAEWLVPLKNLLMYKRYFSHFPVTELNNCWTDTRAASERQYVVQTSETIIQRCLLMTSDPGDLVLDPTCGSGTTAQVAEQWGRRWITIDTSRVALSIARQRLITSVFEVYKVKDPDAGVDPSAPINPSFGFEYKTVPHIMLRSISRNEALDPIIKKHDASLTQKLTEVNSALKSVTADLRKALVVKLLNKASLGGVRSLTDADLRRWLLPQSDPRMITVGTPSQRSSLAEAIPDGNAWNEWQVPFDVDTDWPMQLQDAVRSFREAWKAKMAEVNSEIAKNAEREILVDQPVVLKGMTRVSGPFSVEGVRPEELALGEDGKVFDPTVNDDGGLGESNVTQYNERMLSLLKLDGVTFLGNRHLKFKSLERAMTAGIHGLGNYEGDETNELSVAVVIGPQYGPVNSLLALEAIEAARVQPGIKELIIAGFSFDAAAQQKAREASESGLQVNIAHIRPDVSPGMEGLLKDQRNSQLFTVFGQPEFKAKSVGAGEYQVELGGVCVYNPLTGMVESSNASKVAAWFLDSDYDGQCFCVSQAFFPDSKAWEKIAKALGSKEDEAAFEAFAGTTSLPFKLGQHRRVAIKVIDPRGNEVMGIKTIA